MPEGVQCPRPSAYMSGKARVPVLYVTNIALPFQATKNPPNPEENCLAVFIVWVVGFDCDF